MTKLVDYLDAVTNAPTVEALWALHSEYMASYGFDRIIYGFTRYRRGRSLGDPQDWVLLTNHGDDYMKQFVNRGHLYNAPMMRWA
ncbi:autoinducer binding domain-containing protein, partial [Octadecabacter sp.]|nr:autoinducer binding domain-containing protein [Octadecabacter sp.]